MANKITYTDKVATKPVTNPVNQFLDVDANEVKDKHNLNDDRITANEASIDGLASGYIYSIPQPTYVPTTTPAPTVDGIYKVTEAGTYTNFGGLVVATLVDIIAEITVSDIGGIPVYTLHETDVSLTTDAVPTKGSANVVESGGVFDVDAGKLDSVNFSYAKYNGTGSYSSLTTEAVLNADGHYFEATVKLNDVSNEDGYKIAGKNSNPSLLGVWTNGNFYLANTSGFISTNAFTDTLVDNETFTVKLAYESGDLNIYKDGVLQNTYTQSEVKINRLGDAKFASLLKSVTVNGVSGLQTIDNPFFSDLVTNTNVDEEIYGIAPADVIEEHNENFVTSRDAFLALSGKADAVFDSVPTESSVNLVNSGNTYTYLDDTYTTRDFYIDGLEGVIGTVDTEKGKFVYAQSGLGIRAYQSYPAGTYKFNAVDLYLGTLSEKSDLTIRLYEGTFFGTATKIPSDFTLLAEKEITNISVNDSELHTVVFDDIITHTTGGSAEILAVFVVSKTQDVKVLMPYSDVQNGTSTRAGLYYTTGKPVSPFDTAHNYASSFYTDALYFKYVAEKPQIIDYAPYICVPNTVYAVVGYEINLYYDSLINGIDLGIEGLGNYSVTVVGDKGDSRQRMWQYTPSGGDVGSDAMVIKVYQDGKIITTKEFTLETIAATAPSTAKTILDVGDSNTDFSQTFADKTQTIYDNFVAVGGTVPTFEGSRTNGAGLKNEGNGGFSFESYATDTGTNPFWNGGALDIANYRSGLGMGATKFDAVIISLLTNDANSFFGSGFAIWNKDGEDTIVQYAKDVFDAFLADNASTKIIVSMPPITANTKNAFGQNYGASDNDRLKDSVFRLRKRFIDEFDQGAYNANIEINAGGLCIDRYYGYTRATTQIANRIAVNEEWHNNAFHCNEDGYEQYADGIFPQILNAVN